MNKKSPLYVVGFMVVLCIVFGSAIAAVYYLTAPITHQNELLNRNRAIANAFGLKVAASSATAFESAVSQNIDRSTIKGSGRIWEIFIRKESPKNIGFVFKGIGFWDVISGIVVLSPDLSAITGIRFLEQHETPGLGARIEEAWFIDQFAGKSIAWGNRPDRRIIIGAGEKGLANRVDGITGATQTTLALMRTLNDDLEAFKKDFSARTHQAGMQTAEGGVAWR